MPFKGLFENITSSHKNTHLLGATTELLQEKETNYAVLQAYDIIE